MPTTIVPSPPYPKAPITEGLIHLAMPETASDDDLQKLVKRFVTTYPQAEPLMAARVASDTTGRPSTIEQYLQGYRAKSTDQADIVVILKDGIAASRLPPYPGWHHLLERAHSAWTLWCGTMKSGVPKRISVRYINRIDIAAKQGSSPNIEDYVRLVPRVPGFSKEPPTGFFVQVTKPTNVEYWNTTISSYIASPPPLINCVSVFLDIDVFRTVKIPEYDSDLWECIDQVRTLKDTIFESCITNNARRLFV